MQSLTGSLLSELSNTTSTDADMTACPTPSCVTPRPCDALTCAEAAQLRRLAAICYVWQAITHQVLFGLKGGARTCSSFCRSWAGTCVNMSFNTNRMAAIARSCKLAPDLAFLPRNSTCSMISRRTMEEIRFARSVCTNCIEH